MLDTPAPARPAQDSAPCDPEAVVVDFPLRGEWVAPNTPGKRVPSHGTDLLGQRYAYDFMRIDPAVKGFRFYRGSSAAYLFRGVRLEDCLGWGEPVHSPVDGVVVAAGDGWPERQPVHPLRDLAVVLKNAFTFDPWRATDLRPIVGNHLIIHAKDAGGLEVGGRDAAGQGLFVALCHLRRGSLAVSVGDSVSAGQVLAALGHSGNSTAPHLHFQLMDAADPLQANGVPCRFREYEVLREGRWETVRNGIPKHTERIRKL